jgi:integrase
MDSPAEDVTPALFRDTVRTVTRAPVSTNRYLSRIKAVVRFAHAEGKLERLPAIIGMRRPHSERKRDRVLTADEIRGLWPALEAALARLPRAGRSFAAAIKMMLLCGTRLGETLAATWSQFSLEGPEPLWRLPAQARKGFACNFGWDFVTGVGSNQGLNGK